MTYGQKLRDPRWQKLRLKVFERDGWKCHRPGCQNADNTPLPVHHRGYLSGRDPCDYPRTNFETLCEKCHERAHDTVAAVERSLEEGGIYAWDERPELLGFEPYKYLTERNGRVVCACIRLDYNPDAPDILLPGNTSEIMAKSRKFIGQEEFIPVFITPWMPDGNAADAGGLRPPRRMPSRSISSKSMPQTGKFRSPWCCFWKSNRLPGTNRNLQSNETSR